MQTPIWPWAETNQGLLSAVQGIFSLIALGAALVSLLRQFGAARQAREQRISDYVEVVLDLIDSLISKGEAAIAEAAVAPAGLDIAAFGTWNSLRTLTVGALEAVRQTPPPQAELAVAMVRLSRVVDSKPGPLTFDQLAHSRSSSLPARSARRRAGTADPPREAR